MLPVYAFGAAVRGKITPGNRRRDVSIQVKPPAYLQGRGIKIDSPNQKGACGFLPQAQADRVFNPDANGFTIAVRVKTTNNAYMQRVVTKRGTSFVFARTLLRREKKLTVGNSQANSSFSLPQSPLRPGGVYWSARASLSLNGAQVS